jgi:retron-type reverse transcriptase
MSKIITLDITNLYTSIPSNEVIELINQKLQELGLDSKNLQDEVIELAKVTIHQNYFESNNMFWQQDSGTPMGSPISSILAEIFLQNLENKWYPSMINTRHIQYIGRYVDDVLIVYDSALSTADAILHDHNDMHSNIIFFFFFF